MIIPVILSFFFTLTFFYFYNKTTKETVKIFPKLQVIVPSPECQNDCQIILQDQNIDSIKIKLIKLTREYNPKLDLSAAKDLVESAPCIILSNLSKEDAFIIKKKLEYFGATVELIQK